MAFLKKAQRAGETLAYTTIRVRLHPDQAQAARMDATFHCCRYLWNQMLSDEREFYAATDRHFIPTPARYKKRAPFLKEADSQALVAVHQNIQRAFQSFFRDPEHYGYPAFKRKKDSRNSYRTYCHYSKTGGPPSVRLTPHGVVLPKLGEVRAHLHRKPRRGWHLQYATVTRTPTGKYYCSLLYQYPVREREEEPIDPARTLGLSFSARHFYVDSEGHRADPPRWEREAEEKLRRLHRELARKQRGSQNYERTLQRLRLQYERIANQRQDFIHQETRRIANAWQTVCVRGDDLQKLAQVLPSGVGLSRGVGRFRDCLAYKLRRAGGHYVEVEGFQPTTRTCSRCGAARDPIPPGVKRWRCPSCGALLDREENAARNIRAAGLRMTRSG